MPKYVKGATWRDVLAGRPVLKGENHRKPPRQRNGMSRTQRTFKCRDCPYTEAIKNRAGVNDRNHRCAACGGIMDPLPRSDHKPGSGRDPIR